MVQKVTTTSLLLQYVPYTNEEHLFQNSDKARDAFLASEEQLQQLNAYMEVYHECDKQLENALIMYMLFKFLTKLYPLTRTMLKMNFLSKLK